MRAAIHIFEQTCKHQLANSIYLTEQITPLFHWFAHNYRNVIGSEYLAGKVPFGQIDKRAYAMKRSQTLPLQTINLTIFYLSMYLNIFRIMRQLFTNAYAA